MKNRRYVGIEERTRKKGVLKAISFCSQHGKIGRFLIRFVSWLNVFLKRLCKIHIEFKMEKLSLREGDNNIRVQINVIVEIQRSYS